MWHRRLHSTVLRAIVAARALCLQTNLADRRRFIPASGIRNRAYAAAPSVLIDARGFGGRAGARIPANDVGVVRASAAIPQRSRKRFRSYFAPVRPRSFSALALSSSAVGAAPPMRVAAWFRYADRPRRGRFEPHDGCSFRSTRFDLRRLGGVDHGRRGKF